MSELTVEALRSEVEALNTAVEALAAQRKGWHVDKTVNLSHIAATITLVIMGGTLLSRQDTRITLLEQQMVEQHARDVAQDNRAIEVRNDLRADLHEIKEDIKTLVRQQRR